MEFDEDQLWCPTLDLYEDLGGLVTNETAGDYIGLMLQTPCPAGVRARQISVQYDGIPRTESIPARVRGGKAKIRFRKVLE
jgi:hypothetical protein